MLYTFVTYGGVVFAYTGVDVIAYFCRKGFGRTSRKRMSVDNVHAFFVYMRARTLDIKISKGVMPKSP